jgi:hypothetical protein
MDFELGRSYGPPGSDSSWFVEALHEVRQGRAGDVPITLIRRHGADVSGYLDRAEQGIVQLKEIEYPDRVLRIACETIVAFVLWPVSDIDHSDELRGIG